MANRYKIAGREIYAEKPAKPILTDKTVELVRSYLRERRTEYMERAFGYFEADSFYREIVGENYDVLMAANKLWRTRPQSTSTSFRLTPWACTWTGGTQKASFEVTFKGYLNLSEGPPIYLLPGKDLENSISFDELHTDDTTTLPRMLEAEMQWEEGINAFNRIMTHYNETAHLLATYLNYLAPWVADLYTESPGMFSAEPASVRDALRLRQYPKTAPLVPRALLDICRLPQTLLAQLKILVSANAPRCRVSGYSQPAGTCGVTFTVSSTRVDTMFNEMREARSYSWR